MIVYFLEQIKHDDKCSNEIRSISDFIDQAFRSQISMILELTFVNMHLNWLEIYYLNKFYFFHHLEFIYLNIFEILINFYFKIVNISLVLNFIKS